MKGTQPDAFLLVNGDSSEGVFPERVRVSDVICFFSDYPCPSVMKTSCLRV